MAISAKLVACSLIAALGGFLFGFDTVVISGAEQKIERLWGLSPWVHGLVMSAALWGTVVGALGGAFPTDRLGRKPTLAWIGVLYFVSAVWSGLASGPVELFVARFIGGLGVGASTVAGPLYIAEISPASHRGRLTGLYQANIVLGILVAFVSNFALTGVSENDWRWMLGVEAVPAIVYTLLCLAIPESPRWLVAAQGRRDDAERVLAAINPTASPAQVAALLGEVEEATRADRESPRRGLFSPALAIPVGLAFTIAMFNQLSGINAVLYFAPRVFGLTGLSEQSALLQSVGIGLANLLFTAVGLLLIDRLGRRTLLVIGSIGYIVSLGAIAAAFFANAAMFGVAADALAVRGAKTEVDRAARVEALAASVEASGLTVEPAPAEGYADRALAAAGDASRGGGLVVLVGVFAFIASHAVGQGAVIWVFISEVFPNDLRAAGNALGCGTHWVFAALITLVFPVAVSLVAPGWVFAFFAAMMVLQLGWVLLMVPETKGVPLEELERRLVR
jgi:MFS family permease